MPSFIVGLGVFTVWLFGFLPLYHGEQLFAFFTSVAQLVPIVTAIAASFAAFMAWRAFGVASNQLRLANNQLGVANGQLLANLRNQRETTAKTAFREFLKLCADNPDLAKPVAAIDDKNANRGKYEWFVAHFLWAAEEILEYNDPASTQEDWSKVLKLHISYHRAYLRETNFTTNSLPTYSPKFQDFLSKALVEIARDRRAPASAPRA
jgi:hypothetical protein